MTTQRANQGRRRVTSGLVLVAGAVMAFIIWSHVHAGIWADLEVYRAAGRAVLDSKDLYAGTVRGLGFTYPPFAAVAFVPLALLGDTGARIVVSVLSVVAYLTVFIVVRRCLGKRGWVPLALIVVGLALEPFVRTVLLGQVDTVLMALVVIDALVVPPRYRGWLIGLAAAIKLTPLCFLVWLAVRSEWGAAVRALAGFGVTVAVGWLVAPGPSRAFWTQGVFGLGRFRADSPARPDNQSLLGAALRLTDQGSVSPGLAVLCLIVGLGLGAFVAFHYRAQPVTSLASVALGGLLGSPISWTHHWVWALPLLCVLAARRHVIAAGVVAVVFWAAPSWSVPAHAVGRLSPVQLLTSNAYVLVALAVLVVGPGWNRARTLFR